MLHSAEKTAGWSFCGPQATITFNSAYTNVASIGLYSGTLTKPRVVEFALRYAF
jgi:hypothetical protein